MNAYEYKILGPSGSIVESYRAENPHLKLLPGENLYEEVMNKYGAEGWEPFELSGDIWLKRVIRGMTHVPSLDSSRAVV